MGDISDTLVLDLGCSIGYQAHDLFGTADEASWSDFLAASETITVPRVEIELGGQALERWPSELFVLEHFVKAALDHLINTGRQKPDLRWVRMDRFPRETVWEGRDAREAWEEYRRERGRGDA